MPMGMQDCLGGRLHIGPSVYLSINFDFFCLIMQVYFSINILFFYWSIREYSWILTLYDSVETYE